MIQDLHSHTYYSMDGTDSPERTVEAAIAGGIELFGICDHNSGIAFLRTDARLAPRAFVSDTVGKREIARYFDHISLVREKYRDRITVLRGIEIATHRNKPKTALQRGADVSMFDYCMIENLDDPTSITEGDVFAFRERCATKTVGIAHTDMFGFIEKSGFDAYSYFRRMRDENIFWELNVNHDSTHKWRTHAYVDELLGNEERLAVVREAGVRLSVGFDLHNLKDYDTERVKEYCSRVSRAGIKLIYE